MYGYHYDYQIPGSCPITILMACPDVGHQVRPALGHEADLLGVGGLYVYIYIYIYVYMCIHILYVYIYIYIYIYLCVVR